MNQPKAPPRRGYAITHPRYAEMQRMLAAEALKKAAGQSGGAVDFSKTVQTVRRSDRALPDEKTMEHIRAANMAARMQRAAEEMRMSRMDNSPDMGRAVQIHGEGFSDYLDAAKKIAGNYIPKPLKDIKEFGSKVIEGAKNYGNKAIEGAKSVYEREKERLKEIRDKLPDKLPKWLRANKFGLHDEKTRNAPENDHGLVEPNTPEGRLRQEAADNELEAALNGIVVHGHKPKNRALMDTADALQSHEDAYDDAVNEIRKKRKRIGYGPDMGHAVLASDMKGMANTLTQKMLADKFAEGQRMRYHKPSSMPDHLQLNRFGLHDAISAQRERHRPLLIPGQNGSGPRMHAADNALRRHVYEANGIIEDDTDKLHEGKANLLPGHGEAWYVTFPGHDQAYNKKNYPNLTHWL